MKLCSLVYKFVRPLISVVGIVSACIPAVATETQDSIILPVVTVTGSKELTAATAPSAQSFITASESQQYNIATLRHAADIIPNFHIPDYGSRMTSSIYVRGLGSRIDQPSVGVSIDGVPLMNKDAYDFDVDDILMMRMARGPQSTLYGRNTMAGLIEITTLSPFVYQGARAYASYGSANTWRAGASVYTMPKDTWGISMGVGGSGTSGFYDNVSTGKKCDDGHELHGRMKWEYSPHNDLHILNTFNASYLNQGGWPYQYVPTGEICYTDTCNYHRTFISDGLSVQYKRSSLVIRSVTSWQYLNDLMKLDQDFLPLDYFTLHQVRHENVLTQDVTLSNRDTTAKWRWIMGIFGFYKLTSMSAPVTFKDYGIEHLIEEKRNDANPDYPIKWIDNTFPLNSDFKTPGYGMAIYHNSAYHIGRFTLTAGLRLDMEKAILRYNSYCNTAYDLYHVIDGVCEFLRRVDLDIKEQGRLSRTFTQLLPRLGASYSINSTGMGGDVYASIAKGYKSGGYNTQMFSDVLQQRLMQTLGVGASYNIDDIVGYKPEYSWNYELGIRLQDIDKRWNMEAACFYIDCRDQQLTVFPDGLTTGRIMTNAGKTRSVGAELSVHYTPIAPILLLFTYGYTDARFREFDNGIQSFDGKKVPYVPAHTAFLSGSYELSSPIRHIDSIVFQADIKGVGAMYWDEANTLMQPFYILLGASLSARWHHWELQIWGRNITNTNYATFYFTSISHQFLQRGLHSTFGATVRINFESQ